MMEVVVQIGGREALPVWSLPDVTGWNLSPDMLLDRLVNPLYDPTAIFPASFRLDAAGTSFMIPSEQWEGVAIKLKRTDEPLKGEELPIFTDRDVWRKRSIEIIKPFKAYIWLDEFQNWFDKQAYAYETYKIDKDDKVIVGPAVKLCPYPLLDESDGNYIEDVALGDLKFKGPLDIEEKKAQEEFIFTYGPPTVSLSEFIDQTLASAIGDCVTLPTFYQLMEDNGLVVHDGVIEGREVLSSELLATLRKRERDAEKSFNDDGFMFWETLNKERRYSIFRQDVANAYLHAGKSRFPWFNWGNEFVWLDMPELPYQHFGLPAKLEDFQGALKLDSWTSAEALCWLKGRLPDNCRHHQLLKYYRDEIDLIQRALNARSLTIDGSTPRQWIDWARKKGWRIPSQLEKCLNSYQSEEGTESGLSELVSSNSSNAAAQDNKLERVQTRKKGTDRRRSDENLSESGQEDSNFSDTAKPWLIPDPKDPTPVQPWYIPARYFARKLIEDDSNLLLKSDLLAAKVVKSLDKAGIKKRGGKKPFNPATIKKAFHKVTLS